jgi:hypothetical protein
MFPAEMEVVERAFLPMLEIPTTDGATASTAAQAMASLRMELEQLKAAAAPTPAGAATGLAQPAGMKRAISAEMVELDLRRVEELAPFEGAAKPVFTKPNYDAECSYSSDGRFILYAHVETPTQEGEKANADIFIFDTVTKRHHAIVVGPGYDGGPFFSPDGRWICYRTDRLEKDMLQIHVMRADGSGDVAVTSGNGVHWAPYWHPTKPWLIWTGADHSDPNRRPNYDLWIARYEAGGTGASGNGGRADATFRTGPPLRLTDHEGADVLPVFSPDGLLLMWTASRDEPAPGSPPGRPSASQLWVARPDSAAIERDLPVVGAQGARP